MKLKGSATVEVLYILPVVFLVFLVVTYLGFFFHDKTVLQGIVLEGVLIGASQYRGEDGINEEEILGFLQEKSSDRLLFFPTPQLDISVEEDEIIIDLSTEARGMKLEVIKRYPLEVAEEKLRKEARIKGVLDGEEK